eukprot:2611655-Rhodomonas_salina.1
MDAVLARMAAVPVQKEGMGERRAEERGWWSSKAARKRQRERARRMGAGAQRRERGQRRRGKARAVGTSLERGKRMREE